MEITVLKTALLSEEIINDIVEYLIEIDCYDSIFLHVFNEIRINDKAKKYLDLYTDLPCFFKSYYVNDNNKWKEYCRLVLKNLK